VPKILVADDNSNIQKMVILALKDLGIEVTAVGNGEAAVRRLPDLIPDIVLADVFMPVRSGYEVCEYIKKDPRFSHIPVVLLLGAFDPLDENEAKRVGADGILKKPFVPPDPLLTMVKGLLEKSAQDGLVPVAAPQANREVHVEARPAAIDSAPPVSFDEETEVEDFPALGREALDTIGAQAPRSVAAAPPAETEESEEPSVTTSQRDTALGEPAFWHPLKPEGENTAEAGTESTAPSWGDTTESLPRRDEFEGVQSLEIEEAAAGPPQVEPDALLTPNAEPETLHVAVGKAPGLAENAEDWLEAELAHPTPHPEPEPESWPGPAATESAETPTPQNLIEFAAPTPIQTEPETPAAFAPPDETIAAPAAPPEDRSEIAAPPLPDAEEWPEPDTADEALERLGTAEAPGIADTADARPQPTPPAAPPVASPELVEAVVSRVMEKLQPQVIEIVTREVLRPIVEALVRREVEKL
jgi:CheY-like chemotaxis protein